MKTFKVGDRVKCKDDKAYYVTNSLADLVVTKILTRSLVKVRLVDHKIGGFKSLIGSEYDVANRHFVKLNSFKGNIK